MIIVRNLFNVFIEVINFTFSTDNPYILMVFCLIVVLFAHKLLLGDF